MESVCLIVGINKLGKFIDMSTFYLSISIERGRREEGEGEEGGEEEEEDRSILE
tara:strand:- start:356 stop:517 length:162 start_codon:yes stop_codon:yes gene_type:complete